MNFLQNPIASTIIFWHCLTLFLGDNFSGSLMQEINPRIDESLAIALANNIGIAFGNLIESLCHLVNYLPQELTKIGLKED